MKNYKTTAAGILTALPQLLALFGVPLPPVVAQAVGSIGLFLLGLLAKDFNVTGK